MRLTYLTAGAGGMLCGSCLHDNALARALHARGHDVQLIPIYTPIRTDEVDFSTPRVFLGGINIFLRQSRWLRWLPGWSTAWLDQPRVLQWITRRSMETSAAKLGKLAVSVLEGEEGPQRRDFQRLHRWLEHDAQADVLVLSTLLIAGGIPALKARLNIPVVAILQGDDIFLEGLQEPFQTQALNRLRHLVQFIDLFVVHSDFYAERMGRLLNIPKDRIRRANLGVDLPKIQPPSSELRSSFKTDHFTVGFLARMAPEKGLRELCTAYVTFRQRSRASLPQARLGIAGWVGPQYTAYVDDSLQIVKQAGFGHEIEFLGELDRATKFRWLTDRVDVLCVPSPYCEPKGLYALEAMACGVPVISPNHGVFPELLARSGGGILFQPNSTDEIASHLERFGRDPQFLQELARCGASFVREEATIDRAALEMEQVLAKLSNC